MSLDTKMHAILIHYVVAVNRTLGLEQSWVCNIWKELNLFFTGWYISQDLYYLRYYEKRAWKTVNKNFLLSKLKSRMIPGTSSTWRLPVLTGRRTKQTEIYVVNLFWRWPDSCATESIVPVKVRLDVRRIQLHR